MTIVRSRSINNRFPVKVTFIVCIGLLLMVSLAFAGKYIIPMLKPPVIKATAMSDHEIRLMIIDSNLGTDGYVIERSLDGINWEVIADIPRQQKGDMRIQDD